MDRIKAIEQVHQLCGDVEFRRIWSDENSAIVEFNQAGESRLVLVDDNGPRLYQREPSVPSSKALLLMTAGLGGIAVSGLALFSVMLTTLATGKALGAAAVGALALGAFAVGSLSVGALAVGAVALGKVAIAKLAIKETRLGRVVIDELIVNKRTTDSV